MPDLHFVSSGMLLYIPGLARNPGFKAINLKNIKDET